MTPLYSQHILLYVSDDNDDDNEGLTNIVLVIRSTGSVSCNAAVRAVRARSQSENRLHIPLIRIIVFFFFKPRATSLHSESKIKKMNERNRLATHVRSVQGTTFSRKRIRRRSRKA